MKRLSLLPIALALTSLSACGTPAAAPSPAPTTPTSSATPSTTFGPAGYAGLVLGMRAAQVRAAGATLQGAADATCREASLPGPASTGTGGWVSRRLGVALISTRSATAVTPEGIHRGSSVAEVRAAYPDVRHDPDFWAVAVPGHPGSSYWFGFRGRHLGGLTIVLDGQDCVN